MLSQINLPPPVINREMELIFNPVKFGESGIVVCYPACQQEFNIIRFLTYKKNLKKILGRHHNRFAFLIVHLNENDSVSTFVEKIRQEGLKHSKKISQTDSPSQICHKILNSGKDPYLFLFNAHSLKPHDMNRILSLIHDLILSNNRFGVQVFFEGNIYRSDLYNILVKNKKLLRSIEFIPTYNAEETHWYLNSLTKEWKIKLRKKTIEEIISNCFGYLWVLREVVRLIKVTKNENVEEIFNAPSVKLRIGTITNMLANEEKLALFDLLNQKPNKKYEDINFYLLQTGIVCKKGSKYILPLKSMEKLLAKTKIVNSLSLDKKQSVIFAGKDITSNFSHGELRVLKLLLTKKGSLVSRDEIAQAIWKIHWEDKYSDWAIDKIISRLRTSLTNLNLPKNIITTLKGRGFILK
ncbi:hypothetical protein A2774_02525 [Candidatus Roizmanbacteria bacterium RIFCSPHIGHO2_01_FULL_39_12c]|uniref:OmpR/PhoB-type domain-containing protein n=1 Tax=Candidatus Roizmanbacteria bacterium RIFCSPHIGHO2_01_FULL_39_12c TaxID=1802031 RepID=A0A1F7G8W4_9BACT|nr:MAG: hypothetical protein A2774_02525 [Candidatus Roizmanbacteria bacterium RIFCSPHIGHO2_01_FULL_39_12c]OGK47710.1 MAG: hypothetical protein A2963_00435 [Candidatus Roizmanbacteria bacterium RIFCSPLOWO2_01_FULL_40_13]